MKVIKEWLEKELKEGHGWGSKDVKKFLKKFDDEFSDDTQDQLDDIGQLTEIQNLTKTRQDFNKQFAELEKDKQNLREENEELQRNLTQTSSNYQSLSNELIRANEKIEKITEKSQKLQSQFQINKNDLDTIEEILSNLRNEKGELDFKSIVIYKDALSRLEKVLTEVQELKTKLGVGEVEKADLQFEFEREKRNIAANDTKIAKLEQSKKELQKEINKLDEQIAELKSNANENEDKIEELELERVRHEKRLERKEKELKTARKEKQQLMNELSNLQEKLSPSNLPSVIIPETEKIEIKNFLQNYMEIISEDYQDLINHPDYSQEEKVAYAEQEKHWKAEIIQVINKIDKWRK